MISLSKYFRPPGRLARIGFISCILIAGLAACGSPQPARPNTTVSPSVITPTNQESAPTAPAVTEAATEEPVPAVLETEQPSVPAAALPAPQYDLTAVFNYGLHTLNVEEKITYTNRSSEPMTELLLVVESMRYPGVFQLRGMASMDGQPINDARIEEAAIHVPLSQPLVPGQSTGLAITYDLTLPAPVPNPSIRPIPFGYTARQTNLVDWYPYIPPYASGSGWVSHPAGFFGEHQVYEASDYRVNLQIADQNGSLKVAASSAPIVDGQWLRFEHLSARNFVWSVSPDYLVTQQTVGDVEVYGYAFSIHAMAGEAAMRATADALELYTRLFGPYPRKTLTVVEADFLDGMEYDGLYFLSNGFYNLYTGTPGEYLIAIAAHETAHQWWYALVGNDQANEPWLDEAMCTYSERLFYENVHPEALEWWWGYRVNYYQPKGWVNGTIYSFSGTGEPYRSYRDAIYLNGAMFLEELRKLMGDDSFFGFLQAYFQKNTYQLATQEKFFSILQEHTAVDLAPLKQKYFSQP